VAGPGQLEARVKAVVYKDVGDVQLEDVPDPKIEHPQDAIVRLTTSSVCGTDLHFIRGTVTGMVPGTILGHEGVGIVEEVGKEVHNLRKGDRVVIPSTIACGYCSYCRDGYFAQCDNANPNGPLAGTAVFGGPKQSGPFNGLQAEYARVPFATVGPVKLPEELADDQAILLSDVFPTGYFGAQIAHVKPGRTVAVFGCGPVGLMACVSSLLRGAARVFAVDAVPARLELATRLGAESIDYNEVDPVAAIRDLTGGIGVDRAIDAVGVDAAAPTAGPALAQAREMWPQFQRELKEVAPRQHPHDGNWAPGGAPSLAAYWAVQCLAKAGTLGVIGVYPPTMHEFPLGAAMNKNIAINMGNCHHRRYIPRLIEHLQAGEVDTEVFATDECALADILDAYRHFDRREPGWFKVAVKPDMSAVVRRIAA
jgi:threonine dehydrogenase-like Zn-dependent dehydrogenase